MTKNDFIVILVYGKNQLFTELVRRAMNKDEALGRAMNMFRMMKAVKNFKVIDLGVSAPTEEDEFRDIVTPHLAAGEKISAIKAVREKYYLGLKEAKEKVDKFVYNNPDIYKQKPFPV